MTIESKLKISICPQIEILNIVLLTSNYPKISKQLLGYSAMTEEKTEYTDKINEYFGGHFEHPIYSLLDEMIPNGFALGAPVEAVLCLGEPPELIKTREYSDFAKKRACGESKLNDFVALLRDFAFKTKFIEFLNENLYLYASALDLFESETSKIPYIQILEDFYGVRQNSYNIYLTQLSKGSFGPSFLNSDGKLDVYNICGYSNEFLYDREGFDKFINNILWHEFSHPVINPLTEKNSKLTKEYENSYNFLQKYKKINAGYGLWDECINEHIIRAVAIYLCGKYVNERIACERLANDVNSGYMYIPKLLKKIDYYNMNRNTFSCIESFYEELLTVFAESF